MPVNDIVPGDILVWKDAVVYGADADWSLHGEYFLVLRIDKEGTEPYVTWNMTYGRYENFVGGGFRDSKFWEVVR